MRISLFAQKTEERLMFFSFFPAVIYYVNYLMALFGISGFVSKCCYPAITIYAIYVFLCAIYSHGKYALPIGFFVQLLLMISWVFRDNEIFVLYSVKGYILSETNIFLSTVLPVVWICIQGVDVRRYLNCSKNISVAIIVMQLAIFVLTTATGKMPIRLDYMSYTYYGMLSLFVCAYHCKNSLLFKLLTCVAIVLQLIAGCRGAMFTAIMFLAVYTLCNNNQLTAKVLVKYIVIIVLLVVAFSNYEKMLEWAIEILETIGFSSRTLNKLSGESGGFFEGERGSLYQIAVQNFTVNGSGLFGDRKVLGGYVHNWVLEIIWHMGTVWGSIIVISLIYLLFSAFISAIKQHNSTEIAFQIATASALLCVKFMLSSSYLLSPEFLLAVFFLINIERSKAIRGQN